MTATRRRVELATEAQAVASGRRAVDELRDVVPRAVLDDARLLVSELVTNSVRHAGAPAGSSIWLTFTVDAHRLRVSVVDCGSGFEPRAERGHPARGSGWGLFLVREIAERWGVGRTPEGAEVWFELNWAAEPAHAPSRRRTSPAPS